MVYFYGIANLLKFLESSQVWLLSVKDVICDGIDHFTDCEDLISGHPSAYKTFQRLMFR